MQPRTRRTIPGVQYYYNAERPDGTAAEQLRFTVALLFPERRG